MIVFVHVLGRLEELHALTFALDCGLLKIQNGHVTFLLCMKVSFESIDASMIIETKNIHPYRSVLKLSAIIKMYLMISLEKHFLMTCQ